MQRIVEVSLRDYVIDNGVDEDDALTYPLFSTSTMVSLSLSFFATTLIFYQLLMLRKRFVTAEPLHHLQLLHRWRG